MTGPSQVKWDTGFPEPFSSERNTTWRHPDAKLNAWIGQEDIEGPINAKTHRRWSKYRRTLSHGKLDPTENALGRITPGMRMPSGLSVSGMSMSDASDVPMVAQIVPLAHSPTISGSSMGSMRRSTTSLNRDDLSTPPSSPDMSEHPKSMKGLFRRLRRGPARA